MRKLFIYCVLAIVFLAPVAVWAEEPTLESIEEAVNTSWEKVHAYTAKMAMEASVPKGPVVLKSKGNGTIEILRAGEKNLLRMEVTNNLSSNMPLMGAGMEQKVLSVFNGEIVYNEIEMMGMKKYAKVLPKEDNLQNPTGGGSLIDSLKKRGEVTVMPDEEVNGVDAYVLQVKVTEHNSSEQIKPDTIKAYIAKDSGIPVRTVMYDAGGSPLMTANYTDIKVNPELDPKRFEYTPPPGVEVIDLSEGIGKKPSL